MKVLLVGGGITSAITGLCLRKLIPDCHISLWDKARGSGGRITTSKCNIDSSCTADLGLQYVSTTEEFMQSNQDIYRDLVSDGTLESLTCKINGFKSKGVHKHFVVPNGSGYLVKNFLNKAKISETKFLYHVQSINEKNGSWVVETKTGEKQDFDAVILTMPIPQLFLLEGTVANLLSVEPISSNLKSVNYSSRYVLVMFFLNNIQEDWGAQYFDDHPIFRYVALDNIKRNRPESMCAAVFHSTVPFGIQHVDDALPDMEKVLLAQARSLFPHWPEPLAVKCHKWRYSQVTNPYPRTPGALVLSTSPPLLIGGDGFTGSTFDNCVLSSKAICSNLKDILHL